MTRSARLRALLLGTHLLVLLIVPVVLLASGSLARDLADSRTEELSEQAALVALLVEAGTPLVDVEPYVEAGLRLVDAQGVVVETNGPRLGADLSELPEVAAALGGTPATAVRSVLPEGGEARVWAFAAHPLWEGAVVVNRPVRKRRQALEDISSGPGLALTLAAAVLLAVLGGQLIARALDDLERQRKQVEDRLQHNKDFAANASHEFKTPITTLLGTVELLADDPEMPAAQRSTFLDNARTDLQRLRRLVDGLLQLARVEGTEPGVLDLDQLLRDTVAGRASLAGRAGQVPGDPRQLAVALDNLLENAARHGGPSVRVEAWRKPHEAGFDVIDDGPGPVDPRAFERFFTTSDERMGTGLGLSLVRAIAEAHGGRAELVGSGEGETRFRVALPVR